MSECRCDEAGQCPVHDVTPENTPGDSPRNVLHDDSALWHAVYAAAWVNEFAAHADVNEHEAWKIDYSDKARQMADAAVAQLRRRA